MSSDDNISSDSLASTVLIQSKNHPSMGQIRFPAPNSFKT